MAYFRSPKNKPFLAQIIGPVIDITFHTHEAFRTSKNP
jgi:hypothetical protein